MSLDISWLWNHSAASQSHPTASVPPQTCPTTPQVTVPAVTPRSDSLSPSSLRPLPRPQLAPQCPILPPGYHLHPAHKPQPYSPVPQVLTRNTTARVTRPTNNVSEPFCYCYSSPVVPRFPSL